MAKKIVLLAGAKSHAPGDHEHEKDLTLLMQCLQQSALKDQLKFELHNNGWPQQPQTLDNADTIVLFSDGPDFNEKSHPFLVDNRMQIIERQMQRGCGLVLAHYATFFPSRFKDSFLDWCGGYFDYETGNAENHWYSQIKMDTQTPQLAAPNHPILAGVKPFQITEEFYYRLRFNDSLPPVIPLLQTPIKEESELFTVAWALERASGGRSFATSLGHHHKNLAIESFRTMLLNGIVWTSGLDIPADGLHATLPGDWIF
ncbi:MAG: ThuA domain-containing protein [Chitinivibrionales bacterium]|nr:ThuA domain-containing protein [Chitinivibrionales bacterium]